MHRSRTRSAKNALIGAAITALASAGWSDTPPGTDYVPVRQALTVFPTQDDTTVQITDLGDADDMCTVFLADGDPLGTTIDVFTPILDTEAGTTIDPRAAASTSTAPSSIATRT